MLMTPSLPIQEQIPGIRCALEQSRYAVVLAPPGTGKTTRVPLALLDEPWLGNKKIILLEPRRLAARSCAAHMADLLRETIGQTIGYHIRLDRKIGPATRIEVVTEGIFTRKIQKDPFLKDVGLVIFDEFHERNLHSDLGLAFCLESAEALQEDLRILVMSATMDAEAVSTLLGHAPVIVSKGKSFPVDTVYLPPLNRQAAIEARCATAIQQALSENSGDLLVFLPGVGEISRLASSLEGTMDPGVHVIPLYGNLSGKEQARAFGSTAPGERKIILATSIAETSITIDGIRVVIDSGLMRVPGFSPQTGMTRLDTLPVSKASADQRRGRAGRTAPGRCYRLWSEYDHGLLKPFTRPEILSVDLAGVVLELAAWGVLDPKQLKWLDPPDPTAFDQAKQLLATLGALDETGRITDHGKKMVSVGLHPRLSHMVIASDKKGQGLLACWIAAFLNERDFIRFDMGKMDPDIRLRIELMEAAIRRKPLVQKGFKINKGLLIRIIKTCQKMEKAFKIPPGTPDIENTGALLALAYPDRIARKRNTRENTFLTAAGKGAFFTHTNSVSIYEYIVAVTLDGNLQNAKIFLAAPYSRKDLDTDFSHQFKQVQTLSWQKASNAVEGFQDTLFGRIVVERKKAKKMDPDRVCDLMIQQIQRAGLGLLPWTKRLLSLKDRAQFLRSTGRFNALPDLSDQTLETTLSTWLRPFLTHIFSLKQLEQMDLDTAFLSLLSWNQQQVIEKNAPTHIRVPSGSSKLLKYSSEKGILDSPVLEVRLQEMFGLTKTPKIAGSALPVTLHLLSPAGRPVQITSDLESFWKNTYKEVKKDLMGRYPKHFWPEDPLAAQPTGRAKPRNPG